MILTKYANTLCQQAIDYQVGLLEPVICVILTTVLQSPQLAKVEIPKVADRLRDLFASKGAPTLDFRDTALHLIRRHAISLKNDFPTADSELFLPVADPLIIDKRSIELDRFLRTLPRSDAEDIRAAYILGNLQDYPTDRRIRVYSNLYKAVLFVQRSDRSRDIWTLPPADRSTSAIMYVLNGMDQCDRVGFEEGIGRDHRLRDAVKRWEGSFAPLNHLYGTRYISVKKNSKLSSANLFSLLVASTW